MMGRGIDQILPHPSDPLLHEPYVQDAREYLHLAESVSGLIPQRVDAPYIWGDALGELNAAAPAARVVNLETSITRSSEYCRSKGIHYRMHPENIECLLALRPDVCVLANNHVLDYGVSGLVETLEVLERAGVRTAGAGRNLTAAQRPALVDTPAGARLVVFGCAEQTSGVPDGWTARTGEPGIDVLPDLSKDAAGALCRRIAAVKQPGDLVVVSVHWGSNWGYEVPASHVEFAHRLIDGGADLIHGHSSHHPRPIEVYNDRLILYGCGDFLDDYEGIAGYERFRGDLVLMYFATVQPTTGRLTALRMVGMQIRKYRLNRAAPSDARWLGEALTRASRGFGCAVTVDSDGSLRLGW